MFVIVSTGAFLNTSEPGWTEDTGYIGVVGPFDDLMAAETWLDGKGFSKIGEQRWLGHRGYNATKVEVSVRKLRCPCSVVGV